MTTTHSGARLRAVQAAGVAAALLSLPAAAAGDVAEGGASRPAGETVRSRDHALRAPIAGHLTVAGQMRSAARSYERRRLMRVADLLARRVARAERRRPARARPRAGSPAALRERIAGLRRDLRAAKRPAAATATAVPAVLQAIAACESGGDPRAIGGGGLYRGKYQFSPETWASVGGSGDPAAAPEAEQDMRAARLYAQAGATPWPVCGA